MSANAASRASGVPLLRKTYFPPGRRVPCLFSSSSSLEHARRAAPNGFKSPDWVRMYVGFMAATTKISVPRDFASSHASAREITTGLWSQSELPRPQYVSSPSVRSTIALRTSSSPALGSRGCAPLPPHAPFHEGMSRRWPHSNPRVE